MVVTLTLSGSVVVVVEAIEVDVLGDGRFLMVVDVVELLAPLPLAQEVAITSTSPTQATTRQDLGHEKRTDRTEDSNDFGLSSSPNRCPSRAVLPRSITDPLPALWGRGGASGAATTDWPLSEQVWTIRPLSCNRGVRAGKKRSSFPVSPHRTR